MQQEKYRVLMECGMKTWPGPLPIMLYRLFNVVRVCTLQGNENVSCYTQC
jgi:hypothetical protein